MIADIILFLLSTNPMQKSDFWLPHHVCVCSTPPFSTWRHSSLITSYIVRFFKWQYNFLKNIVHCWELFPAADSYTWWVFMRTVYVGPMFMVRKEHVTQWTGVAHSCVLDSSGFLWQTNKLYQVLATETIFSSINSCLLLVFLRNSLTEYHQAINHRLQFTRLWVMKISYR